MGGNPQFAKMKAKYGWSQRINIAFTERLHQKCARIREATMTRLTQSDVSRVLAAVQELHGHTDFSTLPHLMVKLQGQLISADVSSYTLMDKQTNQLAVVGVDLDLITKHSPALMAHYHEHPIVQHSFKTKNLNAVKVTDFVTQK